MNDYWIKAIDYFNSIEEDTKLELKFYLTFYPEERYYTKYFNCKSNCINHINKIVYRQIRIEGLSPDIMDCIFATEEEDEDCSDTFKMERKYYLQTIFKEFVKIVKE
jgi:hypothetical protein